MQIEVKGHGAAAVAAISGEIDGKTAPHAQSTLLPLFETHGQVVLDLNKVTYMSSAGLRMLLLLYRQATAKNGKIVLLGISEEIKDTMAVTGFLKFFTLAASLDEVAESK